MPSRVTEGLRTISSSVRNPVFWRLQAIVGLITFIHYLMESLQYRPPYLQLHSIAPALYAFPIVYSSLHFRRRGALLTGVWCALLSLPTIIIWPQARLDWLAGLTQVATGVGVGLVVACVVEHEARERRRAQEMSARLAVLHRQVAHAQEEERRRIARELHDETVQSLVLLCRGLDYTAALSRLPKAAVSSLQELRTMAEETLGDVRSFSLNLRPPVLDDLGLVAALQWLAAELTRRREIEARVEVTGPPRRLCPETELALFRITQEALHNVEKHAEASRVTVDLAFEEGRFRLSVHDDGQGFEPPASLDSLDPNGNLGLVGMQERAQLLGATLELHTGIGKGTSVTVTLPC